MSTRPQDSIRRGINMRVLHKNRRRKQFYTFVSTIQYRLSLRFARADFDAGSDLSLAAPVR
jgi:hypothetical protein